uniref:Stomatin n=1 Tax=Sphenodon punctatus TaxID=8508 RepID=A0A8D0HNR1_SPHPU
NKTSSHSLGVCGWILVIVSFFFTIITFPISVWMCIKIIKEYERAIIFRLGRILKGGAKGPGLFFVLPCTDNFIKVDMRTISFDIPPQEVIGVVLIKATLDEATDDWGVKVERVEIKDVKLPVQLQRAMAAEAEASREARAKVIAAEGEMNASRALKEASIVISESPAALQLRYLQTLTTIASEKNSTIIFPLPIDLLQGIMGAKGGKQQ